jgi:HD-like signal output (HDOD) protein
MPEVDTIIEKLKTCELPPLPDLIQKIMKLTQDIYADPNDISDLVKMDVSLSTGVLKLANSVAFGYAGKVSSTSEAINRVGITRMRDMVLSMSLINNFHYLNGIDFGQFWNHCLAVGLASELIGKKVKRLSVEREYLYTAGLLHKVGILLLAQNFPEDYQTVLDRMSEEEDRDLWEIEKEVIGVSHNEASHYVFDQWQFPNEVSDVAMHYNDPINAPEKTCEAVYIVHIANFACLNQGIGVGIDRFPLSFYDDAWSSIGLDEEAIPEMIEEVEQMTKRANAIFSAAES